jgi:DNA invertase Pin-like site-specific DNA recombinase
MRDAYVTYYRVSTAGQGRSGLGLEAQQAAVTRFLANRQGTVVESFTEIESGKKNDRPELERALRRCRLTGAVLVVAKLDRLSRDAGFIYRLRDAGVEFIAADMPDANTLTVGVMASLAQYERELISERTKAGLAAAKARGVKLGGPMLDHDRNTDTTQATAARVAKAKERNAYLRSIIEEIQAEQGRAMTLSEIADALNAAGYTTARGKPFTRTQVHRIKTNDFR